MSQIEKVEKQWVETLSRHWWVLLLRGIASIVFGIMLWVLPAQESIETLILIFAVYAFVDGVLQIWTAITQRKQRENWIMLLVWGMVSIVASIVIFSAPGLTTLALLFYIGIWAIVKGILEIVAAIGLRKEIIGEWFLIISGVFSILFGSFLLINPAGMAAAMIWVMATYAFILGVLFIGLSVKLKNIKKVDVTL